MSLSNEERIGRLLHALAAGLRPVVEQAFPKASGPRWVSTVEDAPRGPGRGIPDVRGPIDGDAPGVRGPFSAVLWCTMPNGTDARRRLRRTVRPNGRLRHAVQTRPPGPRRATGETDPCVRGPFASPQIHHRGLR
jgi:hypothetical protein